MPHPFWIRPESPASELRLLASSDTPRRDETPCRPGNRCGIALARRSHSKGGTRANLPYETHPASELAPTVSEAGLRRLGVGNRCLAGCRDERPCRPGNRGGLASAQHRPATGGNRAGLPFDGSAIKTGRRAGTVPPPYVGEVELAIESIQNKTGKQLEIPAGECLC